MGSLGSTTSVRARQMRRVLARWQRSGLTLREFGERHGIPLSTLTWWRRVFRRAGEDAVNGALAETPVVFTEVPTPAGIPRPPAVLEPAGIWCGCRREPIATCCSGCSRPADGMLTLPASVRVFVARGASDLRRSFRSTARTSARGLAPGPVVRPGVRVLQPPTQSREVAGVGARRVLAAVPAAGGRELRGAGARRDQRPGAVPVAGRDRGGARAATLPSLTH